MLISLMQLPNRLCSCAPWRSPRRACSACTSQPRNIPSVPSALCRATTASSSSTDGESWSADRAAAVRLEGQRPDLGLVLVHPQIPQNAGNAARTCAATGVPLHLVQPLGFSLDSAKLKRAGLDYWDNVHVNTHDSWDQFYAFFKELQGPKRLVAFTVFGTQYYAGPDFQYQPGDWLVFGAETSGLPPEAHRDVLESGGALVKIPIRDTYVRSLNLATCVGIGVFEALRQLDVGRQDIAPRASPSFEEVMAQYHPRGNQ